MNSTRDAQDPSQSAAATEESEPAGSLSWRAAIARAVFAEAPLWAAAAYMGGLILLYLFVSVHTSLTLLSGAEHDDALYISLGKHLADGHWLGPYSRFTLMKGPGYPALLALNHWLGTPHILLEALFHCFAVTVFVLVAHRFIRSAVLSALLFVGLLWHPILLSLPMLRVLRDRIYPDQMLLVVALMALVLFSGLAWKSRFALAAACGLTLGWFWLTREEGIWVLPALGLMIAFACAGAFREKRLPALAGTLLVLVAIFASVQIGFRAMNQAQYGMFIAVDFKEANFQRALRALSGVRSGTIAPYVPMTRDTMARVDAVSPSFASLAPYFARESKAWSVHGCKPAIERCDEIRGGWFMWALREAAELQGHYASAAQASAFYGRIADEVEAACGDGKLACEPQWIAEMPPTALREIAMRVSQKLPVALGRLLLLHYPLDPNMSRGPEALFPPALKFLHHPAHARHIHDVGNYEILGWYYRAGNDWIAVEVQDPNVNDPDAEDPDAEDPDAAYSDATGPEDESESDVTTNLQFDRKLSRDLVAHFGDPAAARQRFAIRADCETDCILKVTTPAGQAFEATFAELESKAPFETALGSGTFYVDSAGPRAGHLAPSLAERTAARMRGYAFASYKFLFVPLLGLGLIGFLMSTVFYTRRALANVAYGLAAVFWALVATRLAVVLLVTATSFGTLGLNYMAPAHFALISALVFSCAAWAQLSLRDTKT